MTRFARIVAGLLCLSCALALIPATWLAYCGLMWLPSAEGRTLWSAAALVSGPLPLAFGAVFGWRALRDRHGHPLGISAVCSLLVLLVYAIPLAWGGEMLL